MVSGSIPGILFQMVCNFNYYFAEILKDDIISRLEVLEINYSALEIKMNTSEMILSTLESEYEDFMNILNSIECK